MQRGCPQVSGGGGVQLLRRMGERDGGRRGKKKRLNVCVLFFSLPVKDEKRHAVRDAFDFSASFFFPSPVFFVVQRRGW